MRLVSDPSKAPSGSVSESRQSDRRRGMHPGATYALDPANSPSLRSSAVSPLVSAPDSHTAESLRTASPASSMMARWACHETWELDLLLNIRTEGEQRHSRQAFVGSTKVECVQRVHPRERQHVRV